ncbi:MAG TPA: MgtC/SapB family protein [Dokdonella sp.]|nr:MgtC/SapB family protein [Dokdonella sp.]
MTVDNVVTILVRLGLAVVVGGLIGLNRDLHHKPAGVRTHALVSLGTALMVIAILPPGGELVERIDALSRVIQGVLTGIGFLGAGVILHDAGRVRGLTTAATVWLTALIGVACGAGQYVAVAIACVFAALAVQFGGGIERAFRRRFPDVPDDGSPPP